MFSIVKCAFDILIGRIYSRSWWIAEIHVAYFPGGLPLDEEEAIHCET